MATAKEGVDAWNPDSVYSKEMFLKKPSELTVPSDDDNIDVYFLMSPLMLEVAGDSLGFIGQFHAGVGFVNTTSNVQYHTQFWANAFGNALVLPEVDRENDKLHFKDGGELGTHEGKIDFNYWKHAQKMGTIKGTDFVKYIKWCESEQPKYIKYTLFNLRHTGDYLKQPTLQTLTGPNSSTISFTCFDACQLILQAVRELSGAEKFTVDPATIFRNDIYLWMKPGTEPRKVDITPGSLDLQKAMFFYETITTSLGDYAGTDAVEQIGREIVKSGLDYACYCDVTGTLWMYTPDDPASNVVFDQAELKNIVPFKPIVLGEAAAVEEAAAS